MSPFTISVVIIGCCLLLGLWQWTSYQRRKYTHVVVYGYRRHSAPLFPELFPQPLYFKWRKGEPPKALYIVLEPTTREWSVTIDGIRLLSRVGFQANVVLYLNPVGSCEYQLVLNNDPNAFQLEYEIG